MSQNSTGELPLNYFVNRKFLIFDTCHFVEFDDVN